MEGRRSGHFRKMCRTRMIPVSLLRPLVGVSAQSRPTCLILMVPRRELDSLRWPPSPTSPRSRAYTSFLTGRSPSRKPFGACFVVP